MAGESGGAWRAAMVAAGDAAVAVAAAPGAARADRRRRARGADLDPAVLVQLVHRERCRAARDRCSRRCRTPATARSSRTACHGITAQQFRALLDEYDLRAVARHGGQNTGEIPNAKILGQEYVGSGGTAPSGIGSLAATLASADELDAWGKASVEAGTGKAYIHNHGGEFTTKYILRRRPR